MVHIQVGPFVRAISATSAVIWAELSQSCAVTLTTLLYDATGNQANNSISIDVHTITVGGRHYIAPQLQGLRPNTLYSYHLYTRERANDISQREKIDNQLVLQSFRTLPTLDAQFDKKSIQALRIAYGSCRKAVAPQTDALSAFGRWLRDHNEQRETIWPHLLLLIGDQIYADEPPEAIAQAYPQQCDGATTFEDFAHLYEYTWTQDPDVRQVFATMPTFMIFDDHEIFNNWNFSPQWRATMLKHGHEQVLVDGLVAYWIYQGWGNLVHRDSVRYPLFQSMQEAERSGEDALELLRTKVRREVYGESNGCWHYEIPTMPPIFVMNARTERTSLFTDDSEALYAPTRIMSRSQMAELQAWMQQHERNLVLLVSSVPILLPPMIGLAEYVMGARPWSRSISMLRWLGSRLARSQQRLATGNSFDHWPVYAETWQELVEMLSRRTHDVFVLSGDVHFSYAMEAHKTSSHTAKTSLIQLVSTPLQNVLSHRNQQMVIAQASILRSTYGGLHTRILPLYTADKKKRIQYDLLLQNVLAFVTIQYDHQEHYTVQQQYFGVINEQMQVIGHTPKIERTR